MENKKEIYKFTSKYSEEKYPFLEMARIGSLPSNPSVSIWVNQDEARQEPHFHIIMPDKSVIRIRMKDLSYMEPVKKLKSKDFKNLKKWLLKRCDSHFEYNIDKSIYMWNDQPNVEKMTREKTEWVDWSRIK